MSPAAETIRVLIVDDNLNALKALEYALDREGLLVDCAASGEVAIDLLSRAAYDVVVTDARMPGMTGLELLGRIRQRDPRLPVLFLTAHGSIPSAMEAVRGGASDYLQKPFQPEQLVERIRAAVQSGKREAAEPASPGTAQPERDREVQLLGRSRELEKLVEQIRTLAPKDISVILYGESGTGKELAARALHAGSPRRERPFVAVNCAAIPDNLLENELFGHAKGAYTGANGTHKGLFEEAHTGTLFLDEVGEIPLALQAKLLRVLQEHEFKRIGSTRDIRVDVRVITATNRDLREAVTSGRFREDLYYRINVVPLRMPALRERREDIPLLAHHFRNLFNAEMDLKTRGFTDEALAQMLAYDWPGNIRELRNRIKMAMALASEPLLTPLDLALGVEVQRPVLATFREAKDGFEREYVTKALKLCGGNVKKAAQLAGRDRSTFYDLLKKHDIPADDFRDTLP